MEDARGGAEEPADRAGEAAEDSDSAGFDRFVSRFQGPLLVVTAGDEGEPSGCLVGFATQCSIDPPRFIVCISRENHTFGVAERSDGIAMHLLGDDQTELASLFGERSGDTVPKFEECRWHPGSTGVPVLDECVASVEGHVISRFDTGDHMALLIEPVAAATGRDRPVLTFQSAPPLHAGHPVDS